MILFKTIDPTFVSKAEAELRQYFVQTDCVVRHKKYVELVFLSKNRNKKSKSEYDLVKDFYDKLEESYIGKLSNMRLTVSAINNELATAKERENTYKEKINVLNEKLERLKLEYELKYLKLEKKYN